MDSDELKAAKLWAKDKPEVTAVYYGFKYVNGKRTDEPSIVVVVKKKRPEFKVRPDAIVPKNFGKAKTDVQEGEFTALSVLPIVTRPMSFIARKRPCPAGFSIGHPRVTAGTLGAWVKRGTSDDWLILTNNHVAANSNDAVLGDDMYQPGSADGGTLQDRLADLDEFATINYRGAQPPGRKKTAVARMWWGTLKAIGNAGAKMTGCDNRLRVGPRAVGQPTPNLIDAAICRPIDQSMVDPKIHIIGSLLGVKDVKLGDKVQKSGRTTEHTRGTVEGVGGSSQVSYGSGKVADFDDQIIIRGDNGTEFSAGGDSGSAIVTADGYLCGLLFAGGGGLTIANRISHVLSLLGIRVP